MTRGELLQQIKDPKHIWDIIVIGGGATGLISKINNIKYLDLGALAVSVALMFAVSGIERYMRNRQVKRK